MATRALIAAAVLLCASCVTGSYAKLRTYQPPRQGDYDNLIVGATSVEQAISTLGAPLEVIEVGRGLALTWGWQRARGWDVALIAPIGDATGRVSYADNDSEFPGIVLFFDEGWRLVRKREGFLGQLAPRRQLPRDIDDDLSETSLEH